ncbi:MAG TPA: transposase [Candidatus Paceibacterota bacterium]
MYRKVSFAPDEYYHLYNRGVDKRIIFTSSADYNRFLKMMYACNSVAPVSFEDIKDVTLDQIDRGETLVNIGAYCLMDNHFHILVKEKTDIGITTFMKKLLTGYSMYFNKKYNRSGALFQGRFQSEHAYDDRYLNYLLAYIHLNPVRSLVKEGSFDLAKRKISEHQYSSYVDYLGAKRIESCILNIDSFPQYFNQALDFKRFINEWIDYEKNYNTD